MAISRLSQLDALRGLAAMSVVILHYTTGYDKAIASHVSPLWFKLTSGSIGVELFFAISGFVIFLTAERVPTLGMFSVSRFARLYPPYIVCALLTCLVIFGLGFNHRAVDWHTVAMMPLFVNGLLTRQFIDPSQWTLTLEVCFYLYFGLSYYLLGRRFALRSAFVWVALSVVARLAGLVLPYPRLAVLFNLEYSHFFAAGLAVYLLWRQQDVRLAWGLLALSIVAASLGIALAQGGEVFSAKNLLKAVLLSGLLYAAAHGWLKPLSWRPLVALGEMSYALYLLHQIIGYYAIFRLESMGVNSNLAILAAVLLSIGLAWGVRRWVEVPSQRWIVSKFAHPVHRPAASAA